MPWRLLHFFLLLEDFVKHSIIPSSRVDSHLEFSLQKVEIINSVFDIHSTTTFYIIYLPQYHFKIGKKKNPVDLILSLKAFCRQNSGSPRNCLRHPLPPKKAFVWVVTACLYSRLHDHSHSYLWHSFFSVLLLQRSYPLPVLVFVF